MRAAILFPLFSCLLVPGGINSQPAFTGTSVCGRCGFVTQNDRAKMLAHTCSKHGLNCSTKPVYTPPLPVKTAQQIKEEEDKKDRQEAAEDANDQGMEYYEKKDWATAINYFKVALEYVPEFKDAAYNLKKAEEKLRAEITEKQEAIRNKEEAPQAIQTVVLPEPLQRYLSEADKIVVPPPSWESNIEEQVKQIRLGQNGENKLFFANNLFLAAFDQVSTLEGGQAIAFKLMLIGAKSGNAAQDEAEIVVFRQTAWYERTLQTLKDPKQGPLLIAAIKALREKKPVPTGISPELLKMAKATQDPSLGNSSVHLAMNAMLSGEAKAAFFQTFKMEAIAMLSDGIKQKAWSMIENRVSVLKKINESTGTAQQLLENIDKGIGLADKDQAPILASIIRNKIREFENNIQPLKTIPEEITRVMSLFKN